MSDAFDCRVNKQMHAAKTLLICAKIITKLSKIHFKAAVENRFHAGTGH
jgi:hypothetical protein